MTPRDAAAWALMPGERRDAVAGFFGAAGGGARFGRAIADFVEWQIGSGRIASGGGGSPWWRRVNGHLMLDLREARDALIGADGSGRRDGTAVAVSDPVALWVACGRTDPSHQAAVQARVWEAHQASLRAAVARAEGLLRAEPEDETWFARRAVEMVEHAAATLMPTDGDLLDRMTRRHYPDHYPATAADRAHLEAARAGARAPVAGIRSG